MILPKFDCLRKNELPENSKYYNSPTGKITRSLNKRLDILLGDERDCFFDLIGASPSVLIIHLNNCLLENLKLQDYGEKWVISFLKEVRAEHLNAPRIFNWRNLTVKIKDKKNIEDLQISV